MHEYSASVGAPVSWCFSPLATYRKNRLVSAFRDWHRAILLGIPLDALEYNGRHLTALELERVNLWVESSGAWRCSALDPWSADQVFQRVLSGRLSRIPLGKGGAGRWTSWAALEKFLRDRGESIQGEFRF